MDFEEYQKLSRRTANYPNIGTKKEDAFLYPVRDYRARGGYKANKSLTRFIRF